MFRSHLKADLEAYSKKTELGIHGGSPGESPKTEEVVPRRLLQRPVKETKLTDARSSKFFQSGTNTPRGEVFE